MVIYWWQEAKNKGMFGNTKRTGWWLWRKGKRFAYTSINMQPGVRMPSLSTHSLFLLNRAERLLMKKKKYYTYKQCGGSPPGWQWCQRSLTPDTDRFPHLPLYSGGWCASFRRWERSAIRAEAEWRSRWASTCRRRKTTKELVRENKGALGAVLHP